MTLLKSKKLFFTGLAIAILAIFLDLLSKKLIFELVQIKGQNILTNNFELEIASFFNLVQVRNYGISFGMFSNLAGSKIIFSLIQIAIIIVLLILLYKNNSQYLMIAFSLIIGGALGNLIDRLIYGAVADFLDFHLFNYHWPAFNLADSLVFVGVVMLLFKDNLIKEAK
jgi:signal peptidase II